jgi:diguanylate cyclase (GGDEF)-like protein/PAS domain S-box-containing protein
VSDGIPNGDGSLRPSDVGLGLLFDLIQEAVVVADTATEEILLWNGAAEQLLGYSRDEALSRPLRILVQPYLRDQHLAGIKRFNETGPGPLILSKKPVELAALRKDGSEIFVELTLTTLESSGTPPSWVMGVIRDVTGRRDSLTGLWNRARFEEDVTRHLLEAQRYDLTGAFLFIDVDHLKRLNDTYGHHVGDEALKRLAAILKHRLRVTDSLGRWGGDEFAVLLPRVDRPQAEEIADLLTSSLADEPLKVDDEILVLSASTGLACYGGQPTSIGELAAEADRSMYETKRGKPQANRA